MCRVIHSGMNAEILLGVFQKGRGGEGRGGGSQLWNVKKLVW